MGVVAVTMVLVGMVVMQVETRLVMTLMRSGGVDGVETVAVVMLVVVLVVLVVMLSLYAFAVWLMSSHVREDRDEFFGRGAGVYPSSGDLLIFFSLVRRRETGRCSLAERWTTLVVFKNNKNNNDNRHNDLFILSLAIQEGPKCMLHRLRFIRLTFPVSTSIVNQSMLV